MSNAWPPVPPTDGSAPRSGLVYLRQSVASYFQNNGVEAVVAPVGKKYRFFKLNQQPDTNANRVVFIPGEFDGEDTPKPRRYGSLSRATDNSASVGNPREIMHWDRSFTLSIWAPPPLGNTADEEGSVAIVEDLLEQVLRAVQSTPDPSLQPSNTQGGSGSIAASIQWGDVFIKDPPNEKSFGCELLVSALMLSPFYDLTMGVTYATPLITRIGA